MPDIHLKEREEKKREEQSCRLIYLLCKKGSYQSDIGKYRNILQEPDRKIIAAAVNKETEHDDRGKDKSYLSPGKRIFHAVRIALLPAVYSRIYKLHHGIMACQDRIPDEIAHVAPGDEHAGGKDDKTYILPVFL